MDITLLGVPYDLDQRLAAGVSPPAAFRQAGLAEKLAKLTGGDVAWRMVEPPLPEGTPQERIGLIMRALGEAVAEARAQGRFPLVVGGDCMVSLGVVAGLQRERADVGVLWFDAHGDFNTWETTPSGYLGGMPLAMLVGRGEQTVAQGAGMARPVNEANVVLAGARDLDPLEREALAGSAVTHLTDVESLLHQELPAGPLYLHLDVDVVDPSEVSAVDYPAEGGPSAAKLAEVLRHIAKNTDIAALSVTALNLSKDPTHRSLSTVATLFEATIER